MPDVTVSFTDAQWTRMVAASSAILGEVSGEVTADKLIEKWKESISTSVIEYERRQAAADTF